MIVHRSPFFPSRVDALQNSCDTTSMENVVATMIDQEVGSKPEVAPPGTGNTLRIPSPSSEGETFNETELEWADDAITEAEAISMSQAKWGENSQPGSTSREVERTHTPFLWDHTFTSENIPITFDPASEEWPEEAEQANAGECLWDGDLVKTAENPGLIPFVERNFCYQPRARRPKHEEDYYDDDGFLASGATEQSEPSRSGQFSGGPGSEPKTFPAPVTPCPAYPILPEIRFSIARYLRPGTLGPGQLVPLVERTWPSNPFGWNLMYAPAYRSSLRTSLTYVEIEADENGNASTG